MRIGEVAKRVERSIDTLKRYETEGIIPAARRDFQGWRVYDETDVQTILRILLAEKVPV